MAIQKPSIPKGTRDFSPAELAKRYFIINTIKDSFTAFGFHIDGEVWRGRRSAYF